MHQYQAENPHSKVSLQANDAVEAMKESIKAAGRKAINTFLKSCGNPKNG